MASNHNVVAYIMPTTTARAVQRLDADVEFD
jgi:hypothetical protein